ncbi:hypothetical protein BGZ83_008161 [Gryganskiella cystojenkinii]|nr:hypothetical protein BGZ83_008161 [Gryganskiella cystojenkinii]
MTFSGLPSVRDPKQSLKNANSSSSSASSSSPSNASTTSSPIKSPLLQEQAQPEEQHQDHEQQEQQHQQQSPEEDIAESNTANSAPNNHSSSFTELSAGAGGHDATSAATAMLMPSGLPPTSEPMSAALIEKSFQDLVQANNNNNDDDLSAHNSIMDVGNSLVASNNHRQGVDSHHHLHSYPSGSPASLDLNQQHHLGLGLNLDQLQQQHQQLQIHSGTSLPRFQQELRHPQPQQPSLMQPPPSSVTPTTTTKKKYIPQNLNPAHSAAYRKRLNVNQVCDWCRYRKIRCDRESPCNSCQHSKRECIRSPAAALLGNINNSEDKTSVTDEDDQASLASGKSTKRNRADTLSDGRSRRASKSYRGSSNNSQLSGSSVTSYTSDEDGSISNNDAGFSKAGDNSSLSPVVGSLTLAGLGLATGGMHEFNDMTSSPSGSTSSCTTGMLSMANSPLQGFGGLSSAVMSAAAAAAGLRDQEHLDRMRRIETLLSSVIPGAAEFIAHGSSASLGHLNSEQQQHQQQQHQQKRQSKDMSADIKTERKKSLSLITHGLDQHHQNRDMIMSPQDRLSKIALSSPWSNSSLSGLSSVREEESEHSEQHHEQKPQVRQQHAEYIERMKRIELLLSSVQDTRLAKALISQTTGSLSGETASSVSSLANTADESKVKMERKMSKDWKKANKAEARRANATANKTIVKRPHVAAGFAGQKPPPKLPQAIAEAASKKQATRKKRVSAAAARAVANANAASSSATTPSTPTVVPTATTPVMGAGDDVITTASTNSSMTPEITHSIYGQVHNNSNSTLAASSPTASLETSSTFEHQDQAMAYPQQQQQHYQQYQQQFFAHQQQLQQFDVAHQQRDSLSFQQHLHPQQQQQQQQRNTQGVLPFQHQQQFPMSNIGSMAIPLADPTIANYGSLVVPASSSTDSSPTLSPRTARAESVSTRGMTGSYEDLPQMQQQHQLPYSNATQQMQGVVSGFAMTNNELVNQQQQQQQQHQQHSQESQIHPFMLPYGHSQHQHHASMTIGEGEDRFAEFGLGMGESLENLMKKNVGSLDQLIGLSREGQIDASQMASYLQQHQQQQQQQQQHQHQQQQQQPAMFQDMSRSTWMPSPSGSFTLPSKAEDFSWSPVVSQRQQQQQQQSSQSINISANDSPQAEMELEQLQNQQQQLSASEELMQRQKQVLFQQQHRLFEQLQQQQQQQHQKQQQHLHLRKGSFVGGIAQLPQQQQVQQHRASIQHQHQQSFYIPQMQEDDEDDGGFQSIYDNQDEDDGNSKNIGTPASSSVIKASTPSASEP